MPPSVPKCPRVSPSVPESPRVSHLALGLGVLAVALAELRLQPLALRGRQPQLLPQPRARLLGAAQHRALDLALPRRGGAALSPCHLPSSDTAPPGGLAPHPRLPVTPAQHPRDRCLQVSTRGTSNPSTPSTAPIAPAPMAPAIPVQHPETQYPQFGTHSPSTHGPSIPSTPSSTRMALSHLVQHQWPQYPQFSTPSPSTHGPSMPSSAPVAPVRPVQHPPVSPAAAPAAAAPAAQPGPVPRAGARPAPRPAARWRCCAAGTPSSAPPHGPPAPGGDGVLGQGTQVVGQGDWGGQGGTRGWDEGPRWPKGDPGSGMKGFGWPGGDNVLRQGTQATR